MEDDIDGFDCGLPVVNNWLRNQLKNAGRQAYSRRLCDILE